MRFVPLIRCSDMLRSLRFYTELLDLKVAPYDVGSESSIIDLFRGDAKIQLSVGDGIFGVAVNVEVDEVDDLFQRFLDRGLDTSGKPESPVHQGPLDQTWGTREFYVTDPDGNTLRFRRISG